MKTKQAKRGGKVFLWALCSTLEESFVDLVVPKVLFEYMLSFLYLVPLYISETDRNTYEHISSPKYFILYFSDFELDT